MNKSVQHSRLDLIIAITVYAACRTGPKNSDNFQKAKTPICDDVERCFVYKTRLPSNPRPTTRECVHLVTREHFRSCDKDDSHAIRSAIAKKHHAARKLHGSVVL